MKTCDSCGEKKHRSEEWSLSAELAKNNRRLFFVILVLIAAWIITIFGFVWYLNQYDFSGETTEIAATQDGGGVNIIGNGGVIYGTTGEDGCD